jgi:hypothetical protein
MSPESKGILITFSVKKEKLKSNSERTQFYKKLYGWEQTVPGEKKEYVYHREGVLEGVPHQRVDQSSFIVPEDSFEKIMDFFDEWRNKIIFKSFKVILDDDDFFKEFDDMRNTMREARKRMMERME